LIDESVRLEDHHILVFIGGFDGVTITVRGSSKRSDSKPILATEF